MTKLKLTADPTFKASVNIPVAGTAPAPVEFTFRHRTKGDFVKWKGEASEKADIDIVMDIATAWDLVEPWDRDHVEQLLQNYAGAAAVISDTYTRELLGIPQRGVA